MQHSLFSIACLAIASGMLFSCTPNNPDLDTTVTDTYPRLQALAIPAPQAQAKAFSYTHHGITVDDPYQWLKDPNYPDTQDPEVLGYLKAENAYFDAFLKPHEGLVNTLFEEFKGRVDETESSVPFTLNGYEYRYEYRQGDNYPTYLRRALDSDHEQVFLDVPALAKEYDYFVVGDWEISPNNQLLIYTVDTSGDERYVAVVKDLRSDEVLPIDLNNIGGSVEFTPDGNGIVYEKLSLDRWYVESINLRLLDPSEAVAPDHVLFTESDPKFFLGASFTSDHRWLVKSSYSGGNNDVELLPADDLFGEPVELIKRTDAVSAEVDSVGQQLFVMINDLHVNGRLVKVDGGLAPAAMRDKSNWQTLIAGNDAMYLTGLKAFQTFLALELSVDGVEHIQLHDFDGTLQQQLALPESARAVSLGTNPEFQQDHVRINYESMITPDSVFDYDIASQQLVTRKVKAIPSGYDASNYITERLMAPARDGALVPISIVYHKSFQRDGNAPMSLYAYGAYGSGMSPSFSAERLSLLDRGFSFALAHVRGGDEMGYQWYLDGKLDKRMNAFTDFIDVAQYLIAQNYVSAGNISISGRSAGGKMMGAMTVQAPDLWRSVSLVVPFVDVLNTMLDESLPLTPPEWQEWGNPAASKTVFEYLLSYSPYDNITAREYPPMLVTGGLNDPRVTYWEPAKWTAKMRNTKTDNNLLVMRMNMGAGHFANSGRYGRLKDRAQEYAFQLLAHGIQE
ncbi:S9 family peptidase [Alteromonas flava]|uniref:S9 family peptidase n=1 Tax=Alteromonas flava TaxID=2048003 RepID=UPI000C28BA18|nr:S9 family peptidase [Alteromonas flava]